jgi:hypothetical protein
MQRWDGNYDSNLWIDFLFPNEMVFDIVKATSVHANRSLAIWYMQQQPQLK